MDAETLNKKVSQRLIEYGFKGTIPLPKAREIVEKVKTEFRASPATAFFDVIIEMAPIHQVGSGMLCNCLQTIVRVQPKRSASKKH